MFLLYREQFERHLTQFVGNLDKNPLGLGIKYALEGNGKRIRPIVALAAADAYNVDADFALCVATAIELIHNYSLVHDDLPCMDDDDLRRGRPTVHKVFGEAQAVLIGDGMLNMAYDILFQFAEKSPKIIKSAQIIAKCAGECGMVLGQYADISGSAVSQQEMLKMYEQKTGGLIFASMLAPLCGVDLPQSTIDDASGYARGLGELFQLTDDLLDFKSGADKDKITFVSQFGVEVTNERIKDCYQRTLDFATRLKNRAVFVELLKNIKERKK